MSLDLFHWYPWRPPECVGGNFARFLALDDACDGRMVDEETYSTVELDRTCVMPVFSLFKMPYSSPHEVHGPADFRT